MIYEWKYETPSGFDNILMSSDGEYLTRLDFDNQKNEKKADLCYENKELPIFLETSKWLDIYFNGKNPNFVPKYKIQNITPFRNKVIEIMKRIPYGTTITYNDIAKKIAIEKNIERMSAQAVGGAVGWNPILIIIPCHRVVGTNGNLTGYAGGIKNKIKLLELEKNDMNKFTIPK